MDKKVRYLIDFAAKTLYVVMEKKISHDRAFQAVLREYKKAANELPLKILYKASRDVVSDYYTLRYAEQYVYGSRGSAKRMVRLWLILRGDEKDYLHIISDGIERLRRRLAKTLPKRIESIEELIDSIGQTPVRRLSLLYSYPEWFVDLFVKLVGVEETEKLLKALNEEKWWIRVNTLKADVDTIAQRLLDKGVVVRKDNDLPYMLKVVDYNEPLHHLEEMWNGEIVFQDKASALVVEALDPQPGEFIFDMAAAPGIKDSLIMQLTNNDAHIVAIDISRERTKRTLRVLKMLGADISKIHVVNADSAVFSLSRRPDKIILDAPCTSSGAIGKDPAIKIHLENINWVAKFPSLQSELLRSALRYKVDTVYAVCSLLPFEGEEIVDAYADRLEEPKIPGHRGYKAYEPISAKVKRLFHHIHGTQGFFIARIRGTQ
jgi:16S rRNA (cytosine967-C5)-methyltransferase